MSGLSHTSNWSSENISQWFINTLKAVIPSYASDWRKHFIIIHHHSDGSAVLYHTTPLTGAKKYSIEFHQHPEVSGRLYLIPLIGAQEYYIIITLKVVSGSIKHLLLRGSFSQLFIVIPNELVVPAHTSDHGEHFTKVIITLSRQWVVLSHTSDLRETFYNCSLSPWRQWVVLLHNSDWNSENISQLSIITLKSVNNSITHLWLGKHFSIVYHHPEGRVCFITHFWFRLREHFTVVHKQPEGSDSITLLIEGNISQLFIITLKAVGGSITHLLLGIIHRKWVGSSNTHL